MTAEQILEKIQESIQVALRPILSEKVNAKSAYKVKNTVLDVLHNYYEDGTIDVIPLVDINHRTEIAEIENQIKMLRGSLEKLDSESIEEINTLQNRIESLKGTIRNPNGIMIILKDPETYEPFKWYGRSDYDN